MATIQPVTVPNRAVADLSLADGFFVNGGADWPSRRLRRLPLVKKEPQFVGFASDGADTAPQ